MKCIFRFQQMMTTTVKGIMNPFSQFFNSYTLSEPIPLLLHH